MAFVQVRVKGQKETFLYLRKVRTRTKKEGLKLTRRIADKIRIRARKIVAPFKTGTGDLKKSIKVRKMKGGKGYTVVAGRGLARNYAIYQEKGFGAHWIHDSMVNPRARMKGKADFYFVSRWTPFMSPAYNSVLRTMKAELNRTANKIVRG